MYRYLKISGNARLIMKLLIKKHYSLLAIKAYLGRQKLRSYVIDIVTYSAKGKQCKYIC